MDFYEVTKFRYLYSYANSLWYIFLIP